MSPDKETKIVTVGPIAFFFKMFKLLKSLTKNWR